MRSRVSIAASVLTLSLALSANDGLAGTSRPGHHLKTESASTLPFGRQAVSIALDYRQDIVPVPILDPNDRGDLARGPVLIHRVGFGRAEIIAEIAGWQEISREDGPSDGEYGDSLLSFKVNLVKQKRGRPAFGFVVGMKVPNASNETGLGSDEADVFGSLLISHDWGRHEVRFSTGLTILGDPTKSASQEDLLIYGIGGRHGRRHAFTWEVWGRALSQSGRDIDQSTAKIGYAFLADKFAFDLSLLAGIEDASGDLGAATGVTWLFGKEHPH